MLRQDAVTLATLCNYAKEQSDALKKATDNKGWKGAKRCEIPAVLVGQQDKKFKKVASFEERSAQHSSKQKQICPRRTCRPC